MFNCKKMPCKWWQALMIQRKNATMFTCQSAPKAPRRATAIFTKLHCKSRLRSRPQCSQSENMNIAKLFLLRGWDCFYVPQPGRCKNPTLTCSHGQLAGAKGEAGGGAAAENYLVREWFSTNFHVPAYIRFFKPPYIKWHLLGIGYWVTIPSLKTVCRYFSSSSSFTSKAFSSPEPCSPSSQFVTAVTLWDSK